MVTLNPKPIALEVSQAFLPSRTSHVPPRSLHSGRSPGNEKRSAAGFLCQFRAKKPIAKYRLIYNAFKTGAWALSRVSYESFELHCTRKSFFPLGLGTSQILASRPFVFTRICAGRKPKTLQNPKPAYPQLSNCKRSDAKPPTLNFLKP